VLRKQELDSVNSCFNRAAEDEPLFVLRANDETAPWTIRMWAEKYKQRKLDQDWMAPKLKGNNKHWNDRAQKKYAEARALADLMEDWKHEHGEPA
jgi:hypothetical protein